MMGRNDVIIVDNMVDRLVQGEYVTRSERAAAFQRMAIELVLGHTTPTTEELDEGIVDGANDGGIDGFFIAVNGALVTDPSSIAWPRSGIELEVWIYTCKHQDTFKQAPLDNLHSTLMELMDFSVAGTDLQGRYSEGVLSRRTHWMYAHRQTAHRLRSFVVNIDYISRGDTQNIGDSVRARSRQIEAATRSCFGNCAVRFRFFGAAELVQLSRKPTSLWQKSGLDSTDRTARSTLHGMAMGKRPGARQASPMWVNTEDLPTSDGHPFFERLNRVLEESGFDAFVEGLCEAFYACRLGRPSLRPGRYFRLLFIGYFEGVSSERGIAWRVADSLSLRSFLDLDMTEAAPDHSTLSRTRRRIDVETHEAVFTWVLERVVEAGLVRGKTVGIDATTLEANAAMRSIERRDTGESYEAFLRRLAEASGVETPTRADLARFDRSRKNKKTSNKEWQSPQDPDAKVAKMKDGRTHLAHKAEHGVDMDTGAIVSVTVQDASAGDSATLPETLTMAAEQVELVQPDGPGVEEVVADKGYHSDKTLVALEEIGIRSYVSEPERGQRCWQDKKTGETPPEKRAAQRALYGNRRRIRGARGRRLQRGRSELVERPFAHQYETGGLRRVWVRGHDNVRKRVLIQAAGCNIGLLLRRLTGVGTPRSLQGRALSAIYGLIGRLIDRWGRLTSPWGSKWRPAAFVGSIAHRQAA